MKKKTRVAPAVIAVGAIILAVVIVACFVIWNHVKDTQEEVVDTGEATAELISIYEAAGLELSEEEIEVISDDVVLAHVTEEKLLENLESSTAALDKVNRLLGYSNSYSEEITSGTSSVEGSSDWSVLEDLSGGDETIDLVDVLDYINNQLSYINYAVDNSDTASELIEAINSGSSSEEYNAGYSYQDYYEAMLAHIYTRFSFGEETTWSKGYFSGMRTSGSSGTSVYSNILSQKVYELELTRIDFLVVDTSQTFNYLGSELVSSYMALCNGYKVYLDVSLRVLDIA